MIRRLAILMLLVGLGTVAVAETTMGQAEERETTVSGKKVLFRRCLDGVIRAFRGMTGQELPVTRAYWFAWIAFYPDTQLIE